jgi:hypothetical protein
VDDRFYDSLVHNFRLHGLIAIGLDPLAASCSDHDQPQVQPDANSILTQTTSRYRDAARCKLNHGTRVAVRLCLQCNIWQHHTRVHCWVWRPHGRAGACGLLLLTCLCISCVL